MSIFCWFAVNAAAVTAIAAVVAAVVTTAYFVATVLILRQTIRSANAATKSAKAAEIAATAAQKTVSLMRQQMDEQSGVAQFKTASAIKRAIAALEGILQPKPYALRSSAVPGHVHQLRTVLDERSSYIDHLARTNNDAAALADVALSRLEPTLSDVMKVNSSPHSEAASSYMSLATRTKESLNITLQELQKAQELLQGVGKSS
jgi:hypothetical protein